MAVGTERRVMRVIGGLAALVAASLLVTTPAHGASVVDQSTQAQGFNSAWLGSGQTIAQRFTALRTGALTSVDVYVSRQRQDNTNLTVSIFGVGSGGTPTGNALATRLLTPAEVMALPFSRPVNPVSTARLNVAFATPPRVVTDTTYAIVVASTDTYPAYHWFSSTTPRNAPKSLQCTSGTWSDYEQLSFAAYVDTEQAGSTEGTTFSNACSNGLYTEPAPTTDDSGPTETNLLGPNGNATIVYDQDFTGVAGTGVTDPLAKIYDSDFSPSPTPVGPEDVNCDRSWRWEQILCDPAPTTDSATTLTKPSQEVGATFDNDAAQEWYAYYVVDLGATQPLSTFQVYQMFADAKTTHVSLAGSPSVGDDRPAVTDAGWFTVLDKSAVGAGTKQSATRVTDPTAFSLGGVSTRYVLLKFWNDGSLGGGTSYLEVGGIKLFGGAGAGSSSGVLSPQRQVFSLSFVAADGTVCATTAQSGEAGTWMPLPVDGQCTPPASNPNARLLGWATSPDFPLAIARRQVDNGWGAYEMHSADGQLTGVFIPAGGSTFVSASGNLHPIFGD